MGRRGGEVGERGEGSGERGREVGVRGRKWGMPTPLSTPSAEGTNIPILFSSCLLFGCF